MINYVIYSHTDYLDVLKIQTDYLDSENRYLLINKSDHPEIFSKYKKVFFYDESLSYPARMLSLKEISGTLDYMFFFHEKDIVIKKDDGSIEKILEIMEKENIDRCDMRYDTSAESFSNPKIPVNSDFTLSKQISGEYAFCLTPGIWKISSYLRIMEKYQNSTYRRLEIDAQEFVKSNFSLYRCLADEKIECGLIECTKYFQYIPCTHYFKFIPENEEVLNERMSPHLIQEWKKIIEEYKLKEEERGFNNRYDVDQEIVQKYIKEKSDVYRII
jgi:hypothetical protein